MRRADDHRDEGCTAEIIKESGAGEAVPPRDVSGLIREMEKILADDALRQQYSAAARRYAEAHYDAEGAILAYEGTLAEGSFSPPKWFATCPDR